MHTIVISSKKNYLIHWQVVCCSVKLDGVTGILAKPQAATRGAEERFVEKSEGEIALPKSKLATSAGKLTGTVLS